MFTISSLGTIGGTTITPIIKAPEVVGAARADKRPVWDGSGFVPRLIQPPLLSYDFSWRECECFPRSFALADVWRGGSGRTDHGV